MASWMSRGVIVAGVFALGAVISISAPRAWAAKTQEITLTAGEAYVIKGIDPNTTPEVRFIGAPGAFNTQNKSGDSLIVLGTQRGRGSVKARIHGEEVTYNFVVNGLVDFSNPLKPGGEAPPAISTKDFRASSKSLDAAGAKLDAGAGPVVTRTISEEVGSAPPASTSAKPAEIASAATSSTPMTAGDAEKASVTPSAPETAAASATPPSTPADASSQGVAGQTPPPVTVTQRYTTDPAVYDGSSSDAPVASGSRYLPTSGIALMSGTSAVFDFPSAIKRVSVSNTKVADIQVINPHQLMLVGHEPGFTSLVVWDNQGHVEERQVRTEKNGHQQVLLNVTVAEVNRTRVEQQGMDITVALTKLGLSFASMPGFVATPYNRLTEITGADPGYLPQGGDFFPLGNSSNITYAISGRTNALSNQAFLQFLEDHDLAKILAQPRLLANSGEETKFLSGGEIPIVIAQALNTSVVFKEFGVKVKFLPTVIGKRDIELVVEPEVSKPDYSIGVTLNGFVVPGFVTRRARADVRMHDDQTLIIAGLLLDDTRSTIKKVPYMGDLPYLGGLFRQTYYNHVKTELVMSVSPHIVRPIPAAGEVVVPEHGPLSPEEVRTEPTKLDDVTRPRF
jgi:pilus assembly protein CpaC